MAQFNGPGPRTSDNVEWLEILTYDGLRMRVGATSDRELQYTLRARDRRADIYRRLKALVDRYDLQIRTGIPDIPRRVSGYNLTALLPENGFTIAQALVGTESTCVLVLEAMVRLIPNPKARSLLVLGYPTVYDAADHVPQVMAHRPIGCEGMDDRLVKDIESIGFEREVLDVLPNGQGWLIVEFGGDSKAEADAQAAALMAELNATPNGPSREIEAHGCVAALSRQARAAAAAEDRRAMTAADRERRFDIVDAARNHEDRSWLHARESPLEVHARRTRGRCRSSLTTRSPTRGCSCRAAATTVPRRPVEG